MTDTAIPLPDDAQERLDALLTTASDDLDQVWRTRMMNRFRADAEKRGDNRTLRVLDSMDEES